MAISDEFKPGFIVEPERLEGLPPEDWDCAKMEAWMDKVEALVNLVHEEAYEARRKFPESEKRFTALMEEVGEIGKAFNEDDREGWRMECIQAAAMCIRLAAEGDPAYSVTQSGSPGEFWDNIAKIKAEMEGGAG